MIDGALTGTEIMAVIIFFLTVFGGAFAVWRYIENKITRVEDIADRVERDLADYKTQVAQTYITKQSMRESFEPVMEAIQSVKSSLDHITTRVDRIFESQPRSRARRDVDGG